MSLTVQHLNGDSTFLLLFSPELHPHPSDLTSARGVFSILIDPWIVGSSVINAKWFAVTERVQPSAVSHLSELEEPDVVICSQNKPDHTHKETLLQLRPEGRSLIVAEPSAAKLIKTWNHFDPNRVHALTKYDPGAKFGNSLRLYIPPLSPEGLPGEVVISFIPAKNYVTGLHNAIGITYQAPTRTNAVASVSTIDIPRKNFHLPLNIDTMMSSPPAETCLVLPSSQPPIVESEETAELDPPPSVQTPGHRPQLSRSSNTASSELLSVTHRPSIRASLEALYNQHADQGFVDGSEFRLPNMASDTLNFTQNLPTPPDSPHTKTRASVSTSLNSTVVSSKSSSSTLNNTSRSHSRHDSRVLSTYTKPTVIYAARPKAVSVIYSPHGIPKPDLKPYVQHHLTRLPGALPLTLLLHSFDSQQNPWYLGGNVMTGAAGGIEIARALMARCWVSAHDEQKDDRGVAVKMIKTARSTADHIRRELATDDWCSKYGWMCDVRVLDVGKSLLLSSDERDLLVGSMCDGVRQGLGIQSVPMLRTPISPAEGWTPAALPDGKN